MNPLHGFLFEQKEINMGEQQEFDFSGMENKNEVFYARCRPKIKQALYLQMDRDGFTSMTDWFEQFVVQTLGKKCKKQKKKTVRKSRSK